jgi:N-acetylglutamate synthase-like GNAT family acetyltransferase
MSEIETASAAEARPDVDPFLRRYGRMGPLQPGDRVLLMRDAGTDGGSISDDGTAPVIGCVRLAPDGNAFVLRSLLVHPGHRGRGLGARLVRALLESPEVPPEAAVFCLSYGELVRWYGTLGFELAAARDVPARLAQRQRSLRLQGTPTVCLVHRPSAVNPSHPSSP